MQGEILAAHGPGDERAVLRRLVNNGALTEALGDLFLARIQDGDRLDEVLFGQVPDELLLDVLSMRFRQNVLDFLFTDGRPDFESMEAIFVDNIQFGHDSIELLSEQVVLRDRIRGLRSRRSVLTVRPGNGRAETLDEARILDLCEAALSLRDLIENSPFEEGETLDLTLNLLRLGGLHVEGFFPADDDEPTEVSYVTPVPDELESLPASALEPLDLGQDALLDVREEVRLNPRHAAPRDLVVAVDPSWTPDEVSDSSPDLSADLEAEISEEVEEVEEDASDSPTPRVEQDEPGEDDPTPQVGGHPTREDEQAARDAEAAFRAEMNAELSAHGDEDESFKQVIPRGFEWMDASEVDEIDALFGDSDREVGRGGGQGGYVSEILDVVDLSDAGSNVIEDLGLLDDGIIEAESDEALTEEERRTVRSVNFGPPPLTEGEAREKMELCNEALMEIAAVLDARNGSGSGQAFLQLLLEGTPAQYKALFLGVDADAHGRLNVEGMLRNLRTRPDTEHRQIILRGVGYVLDRALEQSCDELDEDEAEDLAGKVLEVQRHFRESLI